MHLPSQRTLFDIPDDVAYFNCAYMSPLLRDVVAAGQAGLIRKSRPWEISPDDFFLLPHQARNYFAELINADPQGVALIPSASYGLAIAAKNLPITAGSEILILADQFPSNVYAWQERAAQSAARVRVIPRPADHLWTAAVCDAITAQTRVVAIAQCHWVNGALIDVLAVRKACDRVGAALVLDLTQSAGALPFDCAAVRPDFVVASAYKWLLGPYSVGFLYAAPKWRDGEPIEYSWMTRAGSENFTGLVAYQNEYQPGARRYDVGECANFALLPAAIAALKQLLAWGVENIYETLSHRTESIAQHAVTLGFTSAPSQTRAGHFLGLTPTHDINTAELLNTLKAEQVHISARGDSLRITPHLHITDEDEARLLSALAMNRTSFRDC